MNDQLHAAGFVEKTLENDRIERGQAAERRAAGAQVLNDLQSRRLAEPDGFDEPLHGFAGSDARREPAVQAPLDLPIEPGDGRRQLFGARRRLAEPERNRGRLAARILDAHGAPLHPQDSIGRVAQLEYIALQTLDRKVLVDGADQMAFRLQHHFVIGVVRNGAAGGERRQPGAFARTQHLVDRVVMQQRAAAPPASAEPLGQHAHALVEILAAQLPVGIRSAHEVEQLIFSPFARRDFCGDLLSEHVERFPRNIQAVQFAAPHRVEQRRALHQLVARKRKHPTLGGTTHRMPGAADPLQKGIDGARRAQLTDEVHISDVDAELERGGRHQHFQLAALQALFRVEAPFLGKAAVMRGDIFLAQPFGKMPRHALGQPARIHEHQGGAVLADQFGQPIVDLRPDLARHDCLERRRRQLQLEVAAARVAAVDDDAVFAGHRSAADQEPRHFFDGLLRRR